MPPFWQKLFKNKDKNNKENDAADASDLPRSGGDGNGKQRGGGGRINLFGAGGKNNSNLASPPISLPRSMGKGGYNVYDDYPPYEEEDEIDLDIPAALKPQVSREDFDPLGVLGKGSFATVILVRAKPQLQTNLAAATSGLSKPGSLQTKVSTLGGGGSPSSPQSRKASKLSTSAPTNNKTGISSSSTNANNNSGNNLFAMKIIAKKRLLDSKRMKDVFTERDVLTKASHPYLLKLHYTFQSEHKLFFVMDYMAGGDIRQLINSFRRRREPMPYDMARLLAAEVTLALTHLHDHGILYRDLKPENILLSDEGHCALADFGLSKDFGDLWMDEDEEIMRLKDKIPSMRATSFVGSPLYVAPEVLLREKYTKPIDFWGLGILIFTLLFGAEPFRGSNAKEIFDKILASDVRFPTSMTTTPEAMDIIIRLLKKDPQQRLGAPEVFAHPFFRGMDWDSIMKQKVGAAGWVAPPPLPIISEFSLAGGGGGSGSSNNLLAAANANGLPSSGRSLGGGDRLAPPQPNGLGQPIQPMTRSRGMSEIYTPEHHTGQLRGSQQCFFENFSWTNVDHLYALSGESNIVLSDGTVLHGASERSHAGADSLSDFYDAPLPPDTPNELQRSFGDVPLSARGFNATNTNSSNRLRGSKERHSGGGGGERQHSNNSSPPASFRASREPVQPYRPQPIQPPPLHHHHHHHHSHHQQPLQPIYHAPPASAAAHQHHYSHPDMAAGHSASPMGAAHHHPVYQSARPSADVEQQQQQHGGGGAGMGKAQSTGSFFAPPPSEGFDSTLSL